MPSELGIRSFELIEQSAWNNEGMRFSSCLCFRKISSRFAYVLGKFRFDFAYALGNYRYLCRKKQRYNI